jgi:hypothetical protein
VVENIQLHELARSPRGTLLVKIDIGPKKVWKVTAWI